MLGIGLELVRCLLARPRTTVIASVRNPTALEETTSTFSTGEASSLIIVKIDYAIRSDIPTAISAIKEKGVTRIDVLIANAGNASGFQTALQAPAEEMLSDFSVNVLGPLTLFQNAYPLLKNSDKRFFMYVTSSVGSIAGQEFESTPSLSYGCSKAAGNYFAKKVHCEHKQEGLVSVAVHPGWVKTDMGHLYRESIGGFGENMMITVEESVKGMLEIVGLGRSTLQIIHFVERTFTNWNES